MTHSVALFEIGGHDAEGLERFYADLFGWKADPETYDRCAMDTNDAVPGSIVRTAPGDHHVTFYVRVDSLLAALDRVSELGGTCLTPPTPLKGVGTYAHVRDPEGNVIGLLRVDGHPPG
jgi:uncharacterized protein